MAKKKAAAPSSPAPAANQIADITAAVNRPVNSRSRSRTPAATSPAPAATERAMRSPDHQQIAERAFTLWEAEGRPQNQNQRHWDEAEAALKREMES